MSMKVEVRNAINNILSQYPEGQILSEALQNAEDVGGDTFRIVLDLRTHDVEHDPACNGINHDYCRGPAFVLLDNGTGFRREDWGALYNIFGSHESKASPGNIGRFGMGTRSYFAYTDIITVVSNGEYRTLDPLDHGHHKHSKKNNAWAHRSEHVQKTMPKEANVFVYPEFGVNSITDIGHRDDGKPHVSTLFRGPAG